PNATTANPRRRRSPSILPNLAVGPPRFDGESPHYASHGTQPARVDTARAQPMAGRHRQREDSTHSCAAPWYQQTSYILYKSDHSRAIATAHLPGAGEIPARTPTAPHEYGSAAS